MQKQLLIFSSVLFLLIFSAFSIKSIYTKKDSNPIVFKQGSSFEKEWLRVEKFEEEGFPKSALKLVDEIYRKAKNENNIPQVVKSVLYQIKITNYTEEDGLEKSIQRIENELKLTQTPIKQILHSINADLYYKYYQKNKWKIFKQTALENDTTKDIETWSAKKISSKIIFEYQKSLASTDSLQRISIETIEPLIISENKNYKKTWPTIYDFIAYRVVDAFSKDLLSLTKVVDEFNYDNSKYFLPTQKFINIQIEPKDSLSLNYQAVKVLQDLVAFHTELENPDALIDVELFRLKLIYQHSKNTNKDGLYLTALEDLLEQYKKVKHSTYIRYEIAEFSQKKASVSVSNIKESKIFKKYNSLALEQIQFIQNQESDSILIQKTNYLKNLIEQPYLNLVSEKIIVPNENFLINFISRNIDRAELKLYKLDDSKYDKLSKKNLYGQELYQEFIKFSELKSNRKLVLDQMKDYQQHSADLIMEALPKGFYILSMEGFNSKGDSLAMNYTTLNVTNLSFLQRSENGQVEVIVLDRTTGETIEGASVQFWDSHYSYRERKSIKKNLGVIKTDKEGRVLKQVNNSNNILVDVFTHNDRYNSESTMYVYNSNYNRDQTNAYFFTDRTIYRPGQTIYFKAIILGENKQKKWVLKDKDLTVEFLDANYQNVSNLKLKTNAFGSITGSFVIPTGILTGRVQLQTDYGSIYLNVEEYKRPKFEVKLDGFSGNYKLNETVEIKGSALGFAGEGISNAKFKYRVIRQPDYSFYWRYSPAYGQEIEIKSGEGLTNDKGEFVFNFIAKVENLKKEKTASYSYKIEVDVVDITGETHSISRSINIGTVALKLNVDISNTVLIQQADSFRIFTQNLNGELIPAKVSVELYKMQSTETTQNERLWIEPDVFIDSENDWIEKLPNYRRSNKVCEDKSLALLVESSIDTKEHEYWKSPNKLKEGYYKLKLTATDLYGKEVETEKFFVLVDADSKKMPSVDKNLFMNLTPSVEPGEQAAVLIGTSLKNVSVLLEIDRKNQPKEKQWISLSNSKKKILIPITEKDRGNISVSVSYIYKNRVYQKSTIFRVPYTNRQLDIAFETFRNKLYPGEKEEWRIKIKGFKGEQVAAEFLASMYDASLDQFTSNNWSFNILDYYYGASKFLAQGFGTQGSRTLFNTFTYLPNPEFSRPSLNWFGFNTYGRYYSNKKGEFRSISCPSFGEEEIAESMPGRDASALEVVEDEVDSEGSIELVAGEKREAKEKNQTVLQIRKNFDETAFFYPQLKTNKEGDIVFSFTMPESLTKWNLKGFAHTEDLKYGFINEEIITQKDLMVIPNPPRFFRESDKMEFPVKVSNLSNKTLEVDANIRFYDAFSNKEITKEICADFKSHQLIIKKEESDVFKVSLIIPEGYQSISYRVEARAGKFTDGEEKAIPVLSNRMLVTESMPLPIRGKGTKNFKFEKLINNTSKTLKHYNYTLEMTSNPAWYAVQALPYLSEYPYECAEQTFSRFYANALASHIANSNPKIKAVFDTWRSAPKSESLLSNLEKNTELKSALLAETPWVMDAQDESEQKRRIAMLFELNQLANSQKLALRKLKDMQLSSGAWPWFKGMRENRYITQLIVSGMGHLRKLNVLDFQKDYQTKSILVSAIQFLDQEIARDYQQLKDHYDDKQLYTNSYTNQSQIQYLYARSFFNDIVPVPNKSKKAIEYFIKNSQEFWLNQSQYVQALIAITALRNPTPKTGIHIEHKIVASLKEYALYSKEMGMYWKENAGYYWYQAPIEKQALMIELFSEMGGEEKAVEDLKVWLLKQKQTQNWKTTRATADAIYALLMNGTDILSNDEMVKITIGGKVIKASKDTPVEAGTGYFKTSWKGEEINSEMGNITLSKNTQGVSWGAVYWQYFEDLDKITPHKTPLHIEKELFIEKNSNSGPVLTSIEKEDIKVGDKIVVRIVLRVDRAMEYVHLKDMRASGFEPINVMSGYRWKSGLGYYESTKDASTNFFFDYLRKGTYVFEYPLRAVYEGDFSNGISNIQCMYAPEFTSHSQGLRVKIEE